MTDHTQTPKLGATQTVPRSGLWLHTFKVTKSAESMTVPELPAAVRTASVRAHGNEVRRELLGVVSSVLFPATQAQVRKPLGGPLFLGL